MAVTKRGIAAPRAKLPHDEAKQRIAFLKDCIENKGGHRLFYVKGVSVRKESDVHIVFRLIWYGTASDVSREVNDGRGAVDRLLTAGAYRLLL
jgi:hypothetical protein